MAIFKGMYSLIKNKKKLADNTKIVHKDPAPILSADSLLSTEKRQQIMGDIRSLLNLPEEDYQKFFLSTADNFAEFVQNLPETQRSYYAGIGGMLEHALERASLSLFLCRTYLLPEETTLASVGEHEMLWVYAVYTAALVYDVGKIATQFIITLTDQQGDTVRSWLPYEGALTRAEASHYVYDFTETFSEKLRWWVTPLLARQILTTEGFHWLASDNEVLESWLALLSDEHRQVGSLLSIIPLADAQLLESYFTDRKVFRHNLSPQTIALLSKFQKERKELLQRQKELREKLLAEQQVNAEKLKETKTAEPSKTSKQSLFGLPAATQAAGHEATAIKEIFKHDAKDITQRFLAWIGQQTEKKAATYQNPMTSPIQHTIEGILLNDKILQHFISDNKIAHLTITQLKELMTTAEIARPVIYVQQVQFAQQTGQVNSAMLVHNPYLVFPHGGIPPLNVGIQLQSASSVSLGLNIQGQSPPVAIQATEVQQQLPPPRPALFPVGK